MRGAIQRQHADQRYEVIALYVDVLNCLGTRDIVEEVTTHRQETPLM